MIALDRPLIVEGKYDKIRLSNIISSPIITTDGFGVFKNEEKKLLIRRLAAQKGVIVLTDPDGAGLVLRNFLRGILKKEQITNVYIPPVPGKERRKRAASKEGLLGVEGMDDAFLYSLLSPYSAENADKDEEPAENTVTKTDFYNDGLTGTDGSCEKRRILAGAYGLPENLSTGALLEAVNLLGGRRVYQSHIGELFQ